MYKVQFEDGTMNQVEWNTEQPIIENKPTCWDVQELADGGYSVLMNNRSHVVYLDELNREEKKVTLIIDNVRITTTIKEPIDLLLEKMGINMAVQQKAASLKAPMPGLVLKILVTEGESVKKGTPILILEAMKMENVLKAGGTGTVEAIAVDKGAAVEKGQLLIKVSND